MLIELAHTLRCPREHGRSWLVLGADQVEGRDVREGTLGCPVCHERYTIHLGIADLRLGSDTPTPAPEDTPGAPSERDPAAGAPLKPRDPAAPVDDALRLAALLNLADAGGYVVLMGAWARCADAWHGLADVHLVLVNPPPDVIAADGRSLVLANARLPLVAGGVRGVALDAATPDALCADAPRVLRVKGRLVAPVSTPVPDQVAELARDDAWWVAERGLTPAFLASLTRRSR